MLNGIRKNNKGEWVAFRNGRPVGWHSGPGSKANAITEAGSNRVITDADLAPAVVAAAKAVREAEAAVLEIDLSAIPAAA